MFILGVQSICREHTEDLMLVLKQHYKIEEDWKGRIYCGITLKWNNKEGSVYISMPNYGHKQLIEYAHEPPK